MAKNDLKITIGGNDASKAEVVVVEKDVNQPHMAVVEVADEALSLSGNVQHDDPVVISFGGQEVFQGQVAGIEPKIQWGGNHVPTLLIRAFCHLHKAVRGKKTDSFKDMQDKAMIKQVLEKLGITEGRTKAPDGAAHKLVMQHNQTDLEFVRQRAARIGCFFWVEYNKGKPTFVLEQPTFDKPVPQKIEIKQGQSGSGVVRFMPRMNAGVVVKGVTVISYDPQKNKPVATEVPVKPSRAGETTGHKAVGKPPVQFHVDTPVSDEQTARNLAKALLQVHNLSYITGEMECEIEPSYAIGTVVKVDVDVGKTKNRFSGNYFIKGVTHQFVTRGQTPSTILRLARDAELA